MLVSNRMLSWWVDSRWFMDSLDQWQERYSLGRRPLSGHNLLPLKVSARRTWDLILKRFPACPRLWRRPNLFASPLTWVLEAKNNNDRHHSKDSQLNASINQQILASKHSPLRIVRKSTWKIWITDHCSEKQILKARYQILSNAVPAHHSPFRMIIFWSKYD